MQLFALSRRTVVQLALALSLILTLGVLSADRAAASTPAAAATGAASSITIHPDSASGCSGAICIAVTGSGLHVSNWTTTVALSKSMCSTASFWANGVLVATGSNTCGSAGDELSADFSDPGNFANGTVLCNTWSGVSGKPCETVHS
jgi:hypothetical protein